MPTFGSLLTAVDTKTLSPHTIGLDTDTRATGVFHNTFSPVAGSYFNGVGAPSPPPEAAGPRNIGQFCADSVVVTRSHARAETATREDAKPRTLELCMTTCPGAG